MFLCNGPVDEMAISLTSIKIFCHKNQYIFGIKKFARRFSWPGNIWCHSNVCKTSHELTIGNCTLGRNKNTGFGCTVPLWYRFSTSEQYFTSMFRLHFPEATSTVHAANTVILLIWVVLIPYTNSQYMTQITYTLQISLVWSIHV